MSTSTASGPIGYMVRNGVAANLLMVLMLAAGLLSANRLVQEGFQVLALEAVEVLVTYPGGTPEEVEESIVLRIEEQVASLDGVKEVTATAAEGLASVIVALETGVDIDRAVDDVEAAVGRIRGFPAQAERPQIRRKDSRQSLIRLVLHGDVSERALKELAYRAEDELAALPQVSQVETRGVRPYEVSIEAPLRQLRALDVTFDELARAVRLGSLDLSAGSIETRDSELRLRTGRRSYTGQEFGDIVVRGRGDGTLVRVGDIAQVRDGFRDVDVVAHYNGRRAAFVEIQRVAGEQVLEVAEAVEAYVAERLAPTLPAGVGATVWRNDAELYEERRNVLLRNGVAGLLLVLVTLGLFLDLRVALWVVVGMATSFVGALAVALLLDVSLNMNTLFGFVVAVGIVVDDAVVVAEHVHAERLRGRSAEEASILGTRRIRRPLVFGVLTTVAAFLPLLLLPGPVGEVGRDFAIIPITVLVLSLIESLFILPRHLAHLPDPGKRPGNRVARFFSAVNSRVDWSLRRFVEGTLDAALRGAVRHPAPVVAGCVATGVICVSLVPAGIVDLTLLPPVDADVVTARVEMAEGTPAALTERMAREVEAAGLRAVETVSAGRPADVPPLVAGISRTVGMRPQGYAGGTVLEASVQPPAHVATVEFKLLAGSRRDVAAATVAQAWRDEARTLTGARSVTISSDLLDLGAPVLVELSHPDPARLGSATEALTGHLRGLGGVFDVRSDRAGTIKEIRIEPLPEAHALGFTPGGLARELRSAFFGDEVLRLQRGQEDVGVHVRLPQRDRDSIADVEKYLVRVPGGSGSVPLSRIAEVRLGNSAPAIPRKNGVRVAAVSARVDPAAVAANDVNDQLADNVLPDLADAHPGLTWAFGGQQRQQEETFSALVSGFALAVLLIYMLLAVPLRSYTRPLIITAVVPLGAIGAILGHLIMGVSLSGTSVMGMIGLSGIVVNDSLMMVDFIDERRRHGAPSRQAILDGARARFRPILLTSLTTFLGFAPLMLARGEQAGIAAPAAVSMAFGIVFATVVLMLMVPALMALATGAHRRGQRPFEEIRA